MSRDRESAGGWDNDGMAGNETGQRPKARDLNELIRYTMWSVFRLKGPRALDAAGEESRSGRPGLAAEISELCQQAAGKGVVTRGCYALQGLRAEADYMSCGTAPSSET